MHKYPHICTVHALTVLSGHCLSLMTACGPVRVCGHQNHRQHRPGHHAAEFHVCLHWSATLQGRFLKDDVDTIYVVTVKVIFPDESAVSIEA